MEDEQVESGRAEEPVQNDNRHGSFDFTAGGATSDRERQEAEPVAHSERHALSPIVLYDNVLGGAGLRGATRKRGGIEELLAGRLETGRGRLLLRPKHKLLWLFTKLQKPVRTPRTPTRPSPPISRGSAFQGELSIVRHDGGCDRPDSARWRSRGWNRYWLGVWFFAYLVLVNGADLADARLLAHLAAPERETKLVVVRYEKEIPICDLAPNVDKRFTAISNGGVFVAGKKMVERSLSADMLIGNQIHWIAINVNCGRAFRTKWKRQDSEADVIAHRVSGRTSDILECYQDPWLLADLKVLRSRGLGHYNGPILLVSDKHQQTSEECQPKRKNGQQ